MIGIKINDVFIDLDPRTTLSVELNSPAYFGDDVEVMPGSYTFPVDIDMSETNRKVFKWRMYIDVYDPKEIEYECQVWFAGVPMFSGTAKLKEPTATSARLEISIIDFEKIRDKPLNQFDLGGTRHIGSTKGLREGLAYDTSLNPEGYDYVFFPIWNPYFDEYDPADPSTGKKMQNYFDLGTFIEAGAYQAVTPFVKLNYMMERIFTETKFSFKNSFQTTDELRRICLYNNYSIQTESGEWTNDINLKNHVSTTKAGAFLKKVIRLFCLFPDYKFLERSIDLKTCDDIIQQPVKYDWSDRILNELKLLESEPIPGGFQYKQDFEDEWVQIWKEPEEILTYLGTVDTLADIPAFDPANIIETYYVKSRNWFYHQLNISGAGVTVIPMIEPVLINLIKDENSFVYDPELAHIHTEVRQEKFFRAQLANPPWIHAAIYTEGTIPHKDKFHDFNDRLIMYRGYYPTMSWADYPFASSHNYNQDEQRIGDYSLVWNGPDGIFEKFWKRWFDMLTHKKEAEATLNLSLRDILNFSFADKIRIHNQNYLVKKLKLTFTMDGIKPSTAHLITTV